MSQLRKPDQRDGHAVLVIESEDGENSATFRLVAGGFPYISFEMRDYPHRAWIEGRRPLRALRDALTKALRKRLAATNRRRSR